MVEHRVREIKTVMEAAARLEAPADQLMHIIDGAIDNVYERPQVFRFYLHLQTQPEEDLALAKYSRMLNQEMAEQFKVQTRMFERLGAVQPQVRSLYFSSTLQGIMLMISTYPEHYPVSDIKKQLIREFCKAD
ncbi:TetR/AcrR family transcriptional regulator [Paenibacillus sp. JTLBN-2024]